MSAAAGGGRLVVGAGRAPLRPPLPGEKIGYLRSVSGRREDDPPLLARALVAGAEGAAPVAVVVLDALSAPASLVARIRPAASAACGGALRERDVLVAATHTHGSPAVASLGDVPADPRAVSAAVEAAAEAVAQAWAARQPAVVGFARGALPGVAASRRIVQRDGLVLTHGDPAAPAAVGPEGPIDETLGVLAVRTLDGAPLALLTGFGCHPTDHGEDELLSSGWPGLLCAAIEAAGWPDALFLNGAFGDVAPVPGLTMEQVAERIAVAAVTLGREAVASGDGSAAGARPGEASGGAPPPATAATRARLPLRAPTAAELAGAARGAQRFIDPAIYERWIARNRARLETGETIDAELQALRLGPLTLAALPVEPFAALGLELRARLRGRELLVAGAANGMAGYAPPAGAFARGGYETTLGPTSFLAPGAAALLLDAAAEAAASL